MTLSMPTGDVTTWAWRRATDAIGAAGLDVPVHVSAVPFGQALPSSLDGGPYVTIRVISADDRRVVGGTIVATVVVIEVAAWDAGADLTRTAPVVEAFHTALHGQSGPAGGTYVTSCVRQAAVERQYDENGTVYTLVGGEYAVRCSAA